MNNKDYSHIIIAGENWRDIAIETALIYRSVAYLEDRNKRNRITVLVNNEEEIDDFIFDYKELFDNSYRRIVDLRNGKPALRLYRPQYEGVYNDFIDTEWEFVIGRISNPFVTAKIDRWAAETQIKLLIILCFDDSERNNSYAEKLIRRLPDSVEVTVSQITPEQKSVRMKQLMDMARYVHYVYLNLFDKNLIPTELPEIEVEREWAKLTDDKQRMSNLYNVMSIPSKMELLGHDRSDWKTFYALTADEIEWLSEIEHNRWSIERLIQGNRPCTQQERKEISDDLKKRRTDEIYAMENPISLKKKYKTERNAHFDLCSFEELGLDETGLPVTRYDRDLIASIPLIVKTYNDRFPGNG